MGVTFASFHSLGTFPASNVLLDKVVSGFKSPFFFYSLRNLGDILSGSGLLFTFMLFITERISFSVINKLGSVTPCVYGVTVGRLP